MGNNSDDELSAFFENISNVMRNAGSHSGYVDWQAVQTASSTVLKTQGDPKIEQDVASKIQQAVEVAEVWLSEVTAFPSKGEPASITSRAGWITATFENWQSIVEPVARGLSTAMTSLMPEDMDQGQLSIPEELLSQLPAELAKQMQDMLENQNVADILKPMMDMARSMSATMFGSQFGEHLGIMSTEVLSATDIGLPLSKEAKPEFIGENVKTFCEGLGSAHDDAYIYIALRELAHQRLFHHAPWLLTQIQTALGTYASEVRIDTSQIEQAIMEMGSESLEDLSNGISVELSLEEPTAEQKAAIERIEQLLAFIEGWVTTVVLQSAGSRLPHAHALEETFRRRRAAGGPAERFFKGLVGLQLHPRRIREATAMWKTITDTIGIEKRDNLWSHPDLLPTAEDIDNVSEFLNRTSHDLMAELHRAMESDIPAPSEGEGNLDEDSSQP